MKPNIEIPSKVDTWKMPNIINIIEFETNDKIYFSLRNCESYTSDGQKDKVQMFESLMVYGNQFLYDHQD